MFVCFFVVSACAVLDSADTDQPETKSCAPEDGGMLTKTFEKERQLKKN